ncbi:poly(ADP-ribose) glycohydrolase domain-containing protein [Legionella parisiensis]|uniref:Microbial-type PARG catalytic domain-containing protein n=1 Tax=Legionella parisiensis TaxID=45071 RepID=A0A1E5JNR3_9GAMM|nr:poly(ADP-ribose) glycohydrolase domain-containing protein [Legionella parisiensis]KTD42868.1 hypothetical protein Lpar_0845 [Legionella parisiensis]OEH45993.1 hypothetical protein lpari_03045 [Legionella parisiensis]STX78058.1 Uncharacterized protein conserved in bacteria [Legionella parisiensis]
MFLKSLFRPIPKEPSVIKEVYNEHTPSRLSGVYSGERWRHQSMGKTLEWVTDLPKYMELQKQAQENIIHWEQKKSSPPESVEVVNKDWGVATLEATKKHGVPYSVLNMANPVFPGGAALEGGSAQEENMWHRSTCAQSLLDTSVHLDKESMTFRYNETTSNLVEAKIKMTEEEHAIIGDHNYENGSRYKVLFNSEPRVCFRGPEVSFITSGFDDFTPTGRKVDSVLSYSFLSKSDIFPFYELRSAAPELSTTPYGLTQEELAHYRTDLRRRIAAQLDTLIIEGKRNVILGAWGCGEFHNDPVLVAELYGEEINKRAHFFDHIVFPILNTGSHNNYEIFNHHLNGMKLKNESPNDVPALTHI